MSSPEGGWQDPVVGGTVLRIPGIQSPNFSVAGQSGWAILQSGLAFFFNVVLSGGTITGPDFIFSPQGLFFYNGTPGGPIAPVSGSVSSPGAFSNLAGPAVIPAGTYLVNWSVTLSGTLAAGDANNCGIYHNNTFITGSINAAAAGTYPQAPVSVTIAPGDTLKILNSNAGTAGSVYGASFSAAGNLTISLVGPGVTTDPKGSTVLPDGLTIYGPAGQDIFLGLSPNTGNSELLFLSGATLEKLAGGLVSAVTGAGAAEFLQLAIEGPSLTAAGLGDWMALQMASSNQGGTIPAQALFTYVNNAQAPTSVMSVSNLGMALFNTAIPASAPARASLWSSLGYLRYVSGLDGNNYATGLLTAFATGQLVNSTSPATVAPFSFNVKTGIPYKVTGKVNYTGNQAAGTPSFRLLGPAGSVVQVGFHFFVVGGGGGVTSSDWTAFGVSATGPALTAGGGVDFEFSGHITPGADGTLTLAALTSVNADTFTITVNSSMDISPC